MRFEGFENMCWDDPDALATTTDAAQKITVPENAGFLERWTSGPHRERGRVDDQYFLYSPISLPWMRTRLGGRMRTS